MFEISILCVIILAVGYWAALWLMGRHDDVLHGHFVHAEREPQTAALPTAALPAAPVPTMQVSTVPVPAARADDPDSLQSLLNAIKQDLKDAAQL
jgi:hypothetical protein